MKQLVCEMCEGTNLVKQDGVFVCQDCGTKYSVEEAKKLMSENGDVAKTHNGPVNQQSNKTKNLYMLARMEIDKKECGSAQKYYEGILLEEPTSWEAQYFIEYIKCWNSKMNQLRSASIAFGNCFESILSLIKNCVPDRKEQRNALTTVCERTEKVFELQLSAAGKRCQGQADEEVYLPQYRRIDAEDIWNASFDKMQNINNAKNEFFNNCGGIFSMLSKLGDGIEKTFAGDAFCEEFAVRAWKRFVEKYAPLAQEVNTDIARRNLAQHIAKIRKYEPTYATFGLPEGKRMEIEDALRNNNMQLAVQLYQSCSGKDLEAARADVNAFAELNGIAVQRQQVTNSNVSAEYSIKMLGIFGLLPFSWVAGLFVPFFIGRAKNENGGALSKKAKGWAIAGLAGFAFWTVAIVGLLVGLEAF